MKRLSIGAVVGIVIAVMVVLGGIWAIGCYNNLVVLKEAVSSQYSNIDVQLQRRSDLIPNLVNAVKGYTSHESQVLSEVSQSRAKLSGASTVSEKASADAELSSSLNRLLMVVENYPELKADVQFQSLTDNLEGTENRVAIARKDYNAAVQTYNQQIKKFPTVLIASIMGFNSAERFEASANASEVPQVSFE